VAGSVVILATYDRATLPWPRETTLREIDKEVKHKTLIMLCYFLHDFFIDEKMSKSSMLLAGTSTPWGIFWGTLLTTMANIFSPFDPIREQR